MKTLYLRRETHDDIRSVQAYTDTKCTNFKAMWVHTTLPNRRRKEVTLNCFKFRVVWVANLNRKLSTYF